MDKDPLCTKQINILCILLHTPYSDHLESQEAVQASLTKLYRSQKNTPNVVIAGDFKLPAIDWDSQQTTNTRTASKHNKLLEIISEFGLQNMVNDTTRKTSVTSVLYY